MGKLELACLFLMAAPVVVACGDRAQPPAATPSASATGAPAQGGQRRPVDVTAAAPGPAENQAHSASAAAPDSELEVAQAELNLEGQTEIVQQTISAGPGSDVEAGRPVDPGAGAYRGPGDSMPGSGGGLGTLRGVVRYKGTAPRVQPLIIDPAAAKGCVHTGSVASTDRRLLVHANGGVANVVLTIKIAGRSAQPAPQPIVLDQKGCRFEPHVSVVSTGSQVVYANSDSLSHNVHLYPNRNQGMNKLIAAGASEQQQYDKPDQIEIKCDIHPWMNAWVVVTDAPASALSTADGSFEISGLPPGQLQLSLWHEKLGRSTQRVSILAGSVTEIEIEMGGRRRRR